MQKFLWILIAIWCVLGCGSTSDIYTAAAEGDLSQVKSAVAKGDLKTADKRGMTLLHYAASRGHLDVVRYLLESGADPNAQNELGLSPLHQAVGEDHIEVAKELVAHGARVDIRTKSGQSPLRFAMGNDAGRCEAWLRDLGVRE